MTNYIARLLLGRFFSPAPPPARWPLEPEQRLAVTVSEANARAVSALMEAAGKADSIQHLEPGRRLVPTEAMTADPYATLVSAIDEHNGTASAIQVGGDHYRFMPMQPFRFSLANGWDGGAHTILKYVSRHEAKGGREDLEKAIHTVDIRREELPERRALAMPRAWNQPIQMDRYCRENGYHGSKRDALMLLETWVLLPGSDLHADSLKKAIAAHRDFVYPE